MLISFFSGLYLGRGNRAYAQPADLSGFLPDQPSPTCGIEFARIQSLLIIHKPFLPLPLLLFSNTCAAGISVFARRVKTPGATPSGGATPDQKKTRSTNQYAPTAAMIIEAGIAMRARYHTVFRNQTPTAKNASAITVN